MPARKNAQPPPLPLIPVTVGAADEYNPLDYDVLTQNIVDELMKRRPVTLPVKKRFSGAGVYAIFYRGAAKRYARVRSLDSVWPIYVGKAVPGGARKGLVARGKLGPELQCRLMQHAESIKAAKNLDIRDFRCRYLIVTPLWIVMAERFLIENFRPAWNVGIDGFGNHDPGRRRQGQYRSRWDTLHVGRPWAEKLAVRYSSKDVETDLRKFFVAHPPGKKQGKLSTEEIERAVDRDGDSDST